jgi:hypothetical protein
MDPIAATTSATANVAATAKTDAQTSLTTLFIGMPPKTGGTEAKS